MTKPSGRPIVSLFFSRVGEYIDHFLIGIVVKNVSYLKDIGEPTKLMDSKNFSGNSLMVTVEVNALYTSIQAVKWALYQKTEL